MGQFTLSSEAQHALQPLLVFLIAACSIQTGQGCFDYRLHKGKAELAWREIGPSRS